MVDARSIQTALNLRGDMTCGGDGVYCSFFNDVAGDNQPDFFAACGFSRWM